MKALSARRAALDALCRMRRDGARLDSELAHATSGMTEREAALCQRLCYTVVQQGGLIDLALEGLVSFRKTQPQILDILRIGAAQVWFADRIPRYAIVDESVALARKTAPHAAGMVNAVLRKLPEAPPETDDPCIRYSMPRWLKDRLPLPPEEFEAFCKASNRESPDWFHNNPFLKGELPETARPHPEIPDCYRFDEPRTAPALCREGVGIIADPAARLCVTALDPQPDWLVWDACAAPGGKSFLTAFATQEQCLLTSTDSSEDKLALMEKAAEMLGVQNVSIRRMDARHERPGPDGKFDRVLCDVPCSGFGVLRKKPDIRYKREEAVAGLPEIQLAILRNAAKAVIRGGVLLYSTCTVLPEENERVIESFLKEAPKFSLEGFTIPIAGDCPKGMVTLWPHIHDTDGFFICKMRKQ